MMNIVITGGSKGIGKAVAAKFASANHNIFICARNEEELSKTAETLTAQYPESHIRYLPADLGNRGGVQKFAAWVSSFGAPDVLVNNAGTFVPGSIHNEPEGALEHMMATNLYSAYHLTRALLPGMMEKKSGHIFNMCSIASFQAYPNGGAYSISKHALAGFSRNLREEMKPYNIGVTTVYPGATYTDSWKNSGLPESRFMTAEDIAALIYSAFCLSPQACVEELLVRPMQGDIRD